MKPWEGKQLWIWELPNCCGGDMAAIIAKAQELGLNGLIVKAWDSYHYWMQFDKIVKAAHKVGLLVAAWGYSHGVYIPGEVAAMTRSLHAGADWFVIDAEVEYEAANGAALATELLDAVFQSQIKNATIGLSTFDQPAMHPDFPYSVFANRLHVLMPQIYWAVRNQNDPAVNLHTSLSQCARYGLPIAPTGDAYPPATGDQIRTFGAAVQEAGLSGVNFWSWQHCTPDMFEGIKGIEI